MLFHDLINCSSLERILNEANAMIQIGDTTNQAAALQNAEQVLFDARIPSAKYVIMVTDGIPNVDVGREIAMAQRLRNQGIRFILIGELVLIAIG